MNTKETSLGLTKECKYEIRSFDLKKLISLGILQEANRTFFHPLGLALGVAMDIDTGENLELVCLETTDPEGYIFSEIDTDKAEAFDSWAEPRKAERLKHLGFVEQSIPEKDNKK